MGEHVTTLKSVVRRLWQQRDMALSTLDLDSLAAVAHEVCTIVSSISPLARAEAKINRQVKVLLSSVVLLTHDVLHICQCSREKEQRFDEELHLFSERLDQCLRRSRSVSFPPLKTSRFSSSSSYYTEDDTSDSDWSYSIPQRGRSYSVHIAKRQRAYSSPRSTNAKGSRPNHKKWTNDVLESWFFAKWPNSFPSDAEKEKLCSITEINKRQLENWFINARRPDRKRAPMAQAIYERRIPMPVYDHGFTWD